MKTKTKYDQNAVAKNNFFKKVIFFYYRFPTNPLKQINI